MSSFDRTSEEPKYDTEEIPDDRLRLIFTCCHPALAPEAQVALTLRTLCGLDTDEIARTSGMRQRFAILSRVNHPPILLGTSSFTAAFWNGSFYPRGLKPADYLAYYAERFHTVEVDRRRSSPARKVRRTPR